MFTTAQTEAQREAVSFKRLLIAADSSDVWQAPRDTGCSLYSVQIGLFLPSLNVNADGEKPQGQ